MPLYLFPRSLGYLARRTAGASLLLAEQVGVTVFPSAPATLYPHGWAAGYAAGVFDALDEPAAPVATAAP